MKHYLSVFMTMCLLLVMTFSMTAYAAETERNGSIPIFSLAEENAGQVEIGTQGRTEIYTGVSGTGTEILTDSYTGVSDMMPEIMQEWENAEETRAGQETETTQETGSVAEIQTRQESGATQETETAQKTEIVQETETAQETETTQETETETADSTETGSGGITVSGGCLKIIMTDADDQEKKLYGAVFSVFNTENGEKVGELMTGMDGTASLILSAGSYALRETLAPDGYKLSSECTAFSIQEGNVTELAVTNRKIKQAETKAEPGALRITKRDSDSGERLKGAVFGIYHADTDNHVETVTTDRRGVAEVELEPGNYYYLELEAPDGYVLEEEKTHFSIESGRTREITVNNRKEEESSAETETKNSVTTAVPAESVPTAVPVSDSMTKDAENMSQADENQTDESHSDETKKPEDASDTETASKSGGQTGDNKNDKKNGTLWIQNMGAGTGEKLSGAVFAIYGSGNKKAGELAVKNGKASLSIPQGSYYLKAVKAAPGYGVETVRIHFTVAAGGTTLIEITSETDLENTNPQELIPKTGETPPVKIYAFALLCYLTAILCGLVLWKDGHGSAGHGTITSIKRWRISVWGNITKPVRPAAEK